MLPLVNFSPKAGINKDDTVYAAGGTWVDQDKTRWVKGDPQQDAKWQVIGGWELAVTSQLLGVPRTIFSYGDNAGNPALAIGTDQRFYAFIGGLFNVTPYVAKGALTNPFTTTNGSKTVTVTYAAAHNLAAGQGVNYQNAAAAGGITINGDYSVVTVPTATTITITAGTAATSGVTGGGTVIYSHMLPPGSPDDLGGAGYSVNGYSGGTYSSPSIGSSFARTVSLSQFGQNAIYNPRGGGIYEFPSDVSQAQYVTNGGFTADLNWTKGTGWAIAANQATKTAGSASDLTQALSLAASSYYRLFFTIQGYTAGTLTAKVGSTVLASGLNANGTYVYTFLGAGGTGILDFSADATFAGSITGVSVKVEAVANILANAPTQVAYTFVTPERITVALGADQTGAPNPMSLVWSDQNNNKNWTATAATQSGDFQLIGGRRLVAGVAMRTEHLIWSDDSLFGMRYLGDAGLVYSFRKIDSGCGLIGPNAFAVQDGIAFWVSSANKFCMYNGAASIAVPSPVRKYFFDNLSLVQIDKIAVFTNAAYGEFWIVYPDKRDGTECSRYLIYNYLDQTWAVGTFNRSAGCDQGIWPYPLMVSTDGYVYFHDKGFTANAAAFSWFVKSAPIDVTDGTNFAQIMSLLPDIKDQQGTVSFTLDGRLFNNGPVTATISQPITPATTRNDFRIAARQIEIKFAGQGMPNAYARQGKHRYRSSVAGALR